MTIQKRIHKRIAIALEVYWEKTSGSQLVRLEDISAGGCFIKTIAKPEIGETINLEIRLPAGRWMSLQGKVAHHRQYEGFGVCFDSLSEKETSLLAELIDSLDKKV